MAATEKGVWDNQDVKDKITVSEWEYSSNLHSAWSWGSNNYGELGQNNTTFYSSPVQLGSDTNWSRISPGERCSAGLKNDGTLWQWGMNQYGQLGMNNTTKYSSPVQIPGTWSKISCGRFMSSGVKTDGTLWTWGRNHFGQLGHNDLTTYSSPRQLPGSTWANCSSGAYDMFATKTDGSCWSWGYNIKGILGLNDTGWPTLRSSPVQIPGSGANSTDYNFWPSQAAAMYTMFYKRGTDQLWGTGRSDTGQLGQGSDGDNAARSSPVQIPGAWQDVGGIYSEGVVASQTNGTLWAWGQNEYGQLGHNNRTNYATPHQIGSDTTWSDIGGGSATAYGVKTDGTLWAWGRNNQGQLGTNQTHNLYRSSPVQIPGTDWTKVEAETEQNGTCFALKQI